MGKISLSRRQLSIILTIIATILFTHSLFYTKFEIGHFGLIDSLPTTFFAALAFLTIASAILWSSKEREGKLLLTQLLLFIGALWLIPAITGGSPPFVNRIYYNLALVNHIAQEGSFSSGDIWYLSWPGAHIVLALLKVVGSFNYEPLVNIIPMLYILLFLLPLYFFLTNILPKEQPNYAFAGLFLFCLGFWGAGGTSSSGQQVAFLLLLIILALVTYPPLWQKEKGKVALLLALGVLAIATIPTHQLTSLAVVLILAALSLARRTMKILPIIGLCLVLMVVWDMTGGGNIITNKVLSRPLWNAGTETPMPSAQAFPGSGEVKGEEGEELPFPEKERPSGIITLNPKQIAETEVTGHLRGSKSHIDVVKMRIIHSGIFSLIGLAGAIFVLFFRRKRETPSILAMTLAPFLLLPISGNYGEELLQRLYLFSLPFMAYFGAMLLLIRSKLPIFILSLLLLIALPTRVIAHYGNQVLDYLPQSRIAAQKFFDSTVSQGYVSGALPLGYTSNLVNYIHLEYWQLGWQDGKLYTASEEGIPYYIAISNRDYAWYGWFWGNYLYVGEIEQQLDNAVNCNLVYINPTIKLYQSEGTKLEDSESS